MKTLRKGCRGSEVKTLQGYLNLIQDGIFGVLTEESVKEFQSSNGLVAITERQHNDYMKVIEEKMEAEMQLKREEVGDVTE